MHPMPGWIFTTLEGWAIVLGVLVAAVGALYLLRRWISGSWNPFETLESRLLEVVPKAIGALKVKQPVCSLRLYYYDTHAPGDDYGVDLRLLSADRRTALVAAHGRDAPFYLWAAGEEACDGPSTNLGAHPGLGRLFRRVYRIMSDADEEEEVVAQLRDVLQRVSMRLNAADWSSVCPVTDDFVVATADGSQVFADDFEDLERSIPTARLDLLRARGLLGPDGDNWARVELPGNSEPDASAGQPRE